MDIVTVALEKCSYTISIDSKLFNDSTSFCPLMNGDSALIVTDSCVASIHLKSIYEKLTHAGIDTDYIVLPKGENNKSLSVLNQIFTALIKKPHSRDTTIIALGGGVIGDIAGFAAASYLRGVRFIQIPTTLLSQVDSSIGGKTAVNHFLGKNMIGAFYQPAAVFINLEYLYTLPQQEISLGLAEVIKYGIILDSDFFYWIEDNIEKLLALESHAISYCIRRCCKLKADIVVADEHENGQRTLLNLGHTYGHAIETYMNNSNWPHGKAIAVGIMMAVRASCLLGQFSNTDAERISILLQRAGLPVRGPIEMTPEDYLLYMIRDKKSIAGKISLVLPLTLGSAELRTYVSNDIIITSIKDCL